MRTCVQYSWIS